MATGYSYARAAEAVLSPRARAVPVAVQRMQDIGVMEGGRRGAVGEREVLAGEPPIGVASLELALQR
jgi:hypothetical protein